MKTEYMRPSWWKVLADLWGNKTRTLLVVASIAVGVFAIGALGTSYVMFNEDMEVSYASARPANIEIITDYFDDDLVKSVKTVPEVVDAEGRHMLSVRVGQDGEHWNALDLIAAEDFLDTKMNLLTSVTGQPYPEERQLVVREDLMNSTGLQVGDVALIQLLDGTIRELPVVGTVGDQYSAGDFAAPPRGYVTLDTVEWLGDVDLYNRLYVQVENGDDEAAIEAVAKEVRDKVERNGHVIYRTNTNKTTEHPMASIITAILGVLVALGVLIMLLSSSLIINTLNALLTQHRRQIGVMKLVGAKGAQISVMYVALIIFYGVLALIIAIPLGTAAGYGLALFMGSFLSIEIQGFRVVMTVILLQVFLAFAIPLVAGYFPVNKGARTSVRRAISEDTHGEQKSQSNGRLDNLGVRFALLSRPLLLSIRNTFRRKGRLALTLFTLIMAGAIFIAVFNVRESLYDFMDMMSRHYLADVIVTLEEPDRVEQVERDILQQPGVVGVESWGMTTGEVQDENDEPLFNIVVLAPPEDTTLMDVQIVAGRWLQPKDGKALAISDAIWSDYPEFKVGDTLRVSIAGKDAEPWPVVGIFRFADLGNNLLTYANYDTIAHLTGTPGQAQSFRVVAGVDTVEGQSELSAALDQHLRDKGYKISNVEAGKVAREQQSQSLNILVVFLLAMAILTSVVGSIGLTGTMGMNVLERTREIGVMRAIGAVDMEIIKSVVIEGMMIGLLSFIAAAALSFPISYLLLRIISQAIMGTLMPLQITSLGYVIWLGVVIFLSVVASMWPARGAARLTIREVLAYE
ncbi:MAG: FtsX-like permease family protein [Candidatus Promineifilaceae bacterium]